VCLVLLAWRVWADETLLVAANRDEYHARPARSAHRWQGPTRIVAGRDLEAGGTWLGLDRGGRFAAVTNYRGGREPRAAASRGALPVAFLSGSDSAAAYAQAVAAQGSAYSGFNLLVCDGTELWWCSNRDHEPRALAPGIYALGNLLLDSADVVEAKAHFRSVLRRAVADETLFTVLAVYAVRGSAYGTRCASLVRVHANSHARFSERTFDAYGNADETVRYEFRLASG